MFTPSKPFPRSPTPMLSVSIRSLAAVLALLVLGPAAPAQTVLYPGLEGQALLDAVRADYSPTATLGYGPARDALYGWEQGRNGNLRAVYTGFTIVLSGDPSSSALAQGVNTEHTWPQSLGMASEPQRSDMHNLFPTRDEVNSARGNSPFADIPDAQTDTWFRLAQQQSSTPTANLDEWSEVDDDNPPAGYFGRFEPREDHKGNAARSIFYVYAVWEARLASGFLDVQLGDLLAWHTQDSVDAFEADRSSFIASQQGNPNPFVLDSTLARRAFAPDGSGPGPGGEAADLLISEYVEGSSFNKAVEIYNGTGAAVSLAGYSLQVFFNGSTSAGTVVNLAGTIAPGDVFVLAEGTSDPAILAEADQTTTEPLFNGDDAVVLYRGTEAVDAVGQIGFDPGDEWGSGLASTKDNTLRRIADDCTADADPSDAFDPAAHYVGFATNTFDDLGSASLSCEAPGPAFDLTASVSPAAVPPGGSVTVSYTVTNNAASAVTGDLFFTAEIGGATLAQARVRRGTLPAGQTLSGSYVQQVPTSAPGGDYTYTVRIGQFPAQTVDAEAFRVTVTGLPRAGGAAAWVTEGAPWASAEAPASQAAMTVSAYPNPVRGAATVSFAVPEPGAVRVAVYDVLGREVAVLAEGAFEAGEHTARLGGALPSGVYLVRVEAGGVAQTQRVTVLH